ncbi:hypothetical protein KM043_015642 [Ampulex compressa]|nr:hypothetical protein KM043_015642 [Ampulex compressa]
MSVSEHERRYTPSQWSKRYGNEELLLRFFVLAGDIAANSRKTVKCQLDVPYGSTERTKYDVYGTDLPKDAPIFVFVHGGYWQEFSKDLACFAVPVLVAKGIKVIVTGYDLCPQVRIGDIVSQIKTVTEEILKTASEAGSRCVWIAGHSAGAHLAGSLLHDSKWLERMNQQGYLKLFKGLMLIGGLYNLRPLLNTSYNEALKLTEEEIRTHSLSTVDMAYNPIVQDLKVIITAGDCDSPVFVEESREYSKKLIDTLNNVEYILLHDIDHFDIVENLLHENYILTKIILTGMCCN